MYVPFHLSSPRVLLIRCDADAGSSPHTLTPEDAQKLMEFSPKSPITAGSRLSRRSLYQSQDGLASKSSASLRPISLRRTQSHSSIGESVSRRVFSASPPY
jgi:hypothetical protein